MLVTFRGQKVYKQSFSPGSISMKKKLIFNGFFPPLINTHLLKKKIHFSHYKLPIIFSARYINNLKDFLYFIYISKFSDTDSKEQYLAFIIYILQPLINDQ